NLLLRDTVDGVYQPIDVVLERADTVVVTPQAELLPNRYYYLNDSPDMSSLSGATDALYLRFTTGNESATAALDVSDWTLVDGYSAMPLNGGWVIDFNVPLDIVACAVSDSVSINDGTSDIAYSWAVEDSNGRTRLELTPVDALLAGTNYTVTIDGLCDSAGNGLASTQSQTVTTSAITDNTAPTLVSVSPADDATNVGLNTPVVWTFSEPVWFYSSPIENYVYLYVGSSSNRLPGDLSWNVDHTSLTFTPSVAYPANTVIRMDPSFQYLYDTAGNGGVHSSVYYSQFTTESGSDDTTAPTVTQVIPQDGAIDIDRSNTVVLTFSEPLDYSTLSTENFGLYANGEGISTTVSRSYDNRTVTLTSSAIPGDSVISVIATDGVQDLSGNSLADFISVYSTAVVNETARPSISSVYPGNNANDVQLDKN
ncbi:MAG: Ig-like domain-containing protein, partial [Gammaproteobacteria bacterium]|nr:Ig-like domain-containing protein [Gammaproteobacteria bacterium]